LISFGEATTTWVKPFYYKEADLVTSATPLETGAATYKELFLGTTSGSLGETCALAIIIGGLLLIFSKVISPTTPIAFIGTVAFFSFVSGGDVLYQILSGSLLFGAVFMATDYVTTPITPKGKIIFGIGCGVVTFAIRQWGALPEGVSYSILLMNILTPYIDKISKTKPVGAKKKAKEAK
ncbi:MAG: RnfABCDGE type electron transport complex subunit D, partial [Oscillospiraceae bacterium]